MDEPTGQVIRLMQSPAYIDGTYELKMALILLVLAGYCFLPALPSGLSFEGILFFVLALILLVAGPWLVSGIVRGLKRQAISRRGGHIEALAGTRVSAPPDLMILFSILGFLALVVFISFAQESFPARWAPVTPGLIFLVILGLTGMRTRVSRYYLLALAALLAGILLGWLSGGRWDLVTGMGLYFLVLALILLVTGMVILLRFLREEPLPEEVLDERR